MPWIKSEQELREALKVLDEFAYDIIKERRQDPNIADKTGTHTTHRATLVCVVLTTDRPCIDLLSRYITMTDDNGEPFTDKYLRDIVLNFMYVSSSCCDHSRERHRGRAYLHARVVPTGSLDGTRRHKRSRYSLVLDQQSRSLSFSLTSRVSTVVLLPARTEPRNQGQGQ
jgi:hypothetical protein